MRNYLDEYSVFLSETKKVSQNTLSAYIHDVREFCAYCAVQNIKSVSLISEKNIKAYLSGLKKSESTTTRIIASIKNYFKYLIYIGVVNKNPTDSIKTKKVVQKLPDVLDAAEVLKLLEQPSGNDYKSVRDKAMLELLYATGIKVTELIELNVSDINLQIGILNLHSSKKERIVPIYPSAAQHLAYYVNDVRPAIVQNINEQRLFTNMSGVPMSRQGVWKLIKAYADRAGIAKDITPHTLRHSFAAHLLENGAQLCDIKDMLGHADISSTQVYAQFVKSKYVNTYTKFHPLAK